MISGSVDAKFFEGGDIGLEEQIRSELERFANRAKQSSVPPEYDFNDFMYQVCEKLWKSNQEDHRANPNYVSETPNFRVPAALSERLKSLNKGQYYNLVDQTARDLGIYEELESIITQMNSPDIRGEKYQQLRADLNNKLKELYISLRKQGFNSHDLEAE